MLQSSIKTVRRAVLGLVSVLAIGAATPSLADPALWVVKDKDSTIYLFGTVHVLRPQTQWRTPKLEEAFKASEELITEVTDADDPAVMQPLQIRYGLDRVTPLSKKLSPADWQKAKSHAEGMGMPVVAFDAMRPWMAAVTLALEPIFKAGFDPNSGVEQVLANEAKAADKRRVALESVEQQIRFFADLPSKDEVNLLESTLEEIDEGPAKLDALVEAWARGDVKALEGEFVTEMRGKYPLLYKQLIVARNTAWAAELKTRLDGEGVSFVAVGAGHLVGPDSVQAKLDALGIKASRVQ